MKFYLDMIWIAPAIGIILAICFISLACLIVVKLFNRDLVRYLKNPKNEKL